MRSYIFLLALVLWAGCSSADRHRVEGRVVRIEPGRQRYMLFLKADDSTDYRILVSMKDMKEAYRDVSPGQRIVVTGRDTSHWQTEVHMRATEIKE